MEGTDEVNPRAVVTSRRIATAPSIVSVGKTLPSRHHHVNLGLRAKEHSTRTQVECENVQTSMHSFELGRATSPNPRVVAQEAAGYQQRGP